MQDVCRGEAITAGNAACRAHVSSPLEAAVRIAYVTETYPPELNGVSLTVERMVAHLRQRGHQVELIRPRQRGEAARDTASELLTAGCPLPMYPDLRFGIAGTRRLRQRFARTQPQLVHVATEGLLGFAAVAAARALAIPVSSDFRTNFHQYSRYYGLGMLAPLVLAYLRGFHNRTHATFVPTRSLRDTLRQAGFERLRVVGRGVDADLFSPQRRSAALRERWGAGDGPVLLYVGRLAAEKNVALTLAAFEAVRTRKPGTRLVMVGDGPLRGQLQARHPEVIYAGIQRGERLAAHYASADVFVFPSLSETFGNVTLEALASGLPVVAFDAAAAAEHVRDGMSGLLVPAGAQRAFIAATCSLSWQHAHLGALRAHARQAALQAGWPEVLGRFEAHLADTVAAHASAVAAGAALAA
jgi:glycosyltransferase involved in cell wall biosynthesis